MRPMPREPPVTRAVRPLREKRSFMDGFPSCLRSRLACARRRANHMHDRTARRAYDGGKGRRDPMELATDSRPAGASTVPAVPVRHFRQVLLWPLRLMPVEGQPGPPWHLLRDMPGSPWQEVVDEYTGQAGGFHERHYNEFVAFLPYVQRFLYGEGRARR